MKTLYFSYLAVLQKVANHVALLQTASTSKQQVWVGFLNFFVMLFSVFGIKFLSQISLSLYEIEEVTDLLIFLI